jgi:ribosomal L4/L1-like protein
MPTVKVRNLKNEEIGEVQLSDAVFGAPLNEPLIHAAVRNFMANARQGTSATKTRGDVSGAGRKRVVRASHRSDLLCGRAAATYMDHSRATGHTACRGKCDKVLCDRRCLKE